MNKNLVFEYYSHLRSAPPPQELQRMWNSGIVSASIQVALFFMLIVYKLWFVGSYCNDVDCFAESSMTNGGLQWAFKNYLDNIADICSIAVFVHAFSCSLSSFSRSKATSTKEFYAKDFIWCLHASWCVTSVLFVFFAFYNVKSAPVISRPGWHSLLHNYIDFILNQVRVCFSFCCDEMKPCP
jgi:hypothetical protein